MPWAGGTDVTRDQLMAGLLAALSQGLAGEAEVRRTAGTTELGENDPPTVFLLDGSDEPAPAGERPVAQGAPLALLACVELQGVRRGAAPALPAALNQLYFKTLSALWTRWATRERRPTFRSAEFLQAEGERAMRFRLVIAVPYTVRF